MRLNECLTSVVERNILEIPKRVAYLTHFALVLLMALVGMVPVWFMRAAFTAS